MNGMARPAVIAAARGCAARGALKAAARARKTQMVSVNRRIVIASPSSIRRRIDSRRFCLATTGRTAVCRHAQGSSPARVPVGTRVHDIDVTMILVAPMSIHQ